MKEKWIPGYEGEYKINENGDVWSIRLNRHLVQFDRNHYKAVRLKKDNRVRGFAIHLLVYQAFKDDYDVNLVIDHKDGNKHNNHLSNLEQMTTRENTVKAKGSEFTGVRYREESDKYSSHISYKGKDVYLGQYKTKEKAHKIYLEAVNRLDELKRHPHTEWKFILGYKTYRFKKKKPLPEINMENKKIITMKGVRYSEIPGHNYHLISENGDIYSKHNKRHLTPYYRCEKNAYLYIRIEGKVYAIHRLVAMGFLNFNMFKKDYSIVVDHIDNDPINNKLSNLQVISRVRNAIKDKPMSKHGYRGVVKNPHGTQYHAQRRVNSYKLTITDGYETPHEAHLAYELIGEFYDLFGEIFNNDRKVFIDFIKEEYNRRYRKSRD